MYPQANLSSALTRAASAALLILLLLCALRLHPAHAAPAETQPAFNLANLLHALAQAPHGRANYQETRYLHILDIPVGSSGELIYQPPNRMEKRVIKPHPELMVLDGKRMSLQRDGRTYSIDLADHPGALAYASSMRALLAGQLASLSQHYRMQLSGDWQRWSLQMQPTDNAIAQLVSGMTVSGHRDQIQRIDYQQANGDHSEMTIQPLPEPDKRQ